MKSLHAMAVAAVVLTGACTTPSTYPDSIKKFQTSAVATSTTARTYLLDLNRFERNTYLDTLRADPNEAFDTDQFLEKPFAPEAIQARVEALDAVDSLRRTARPTREQHRWAGRQGRRNQPRQANQGDGR